MTASLGQERAYLLWAAKKFALNAEVIANVSVEHYRSSGGCDTCDFGNECTYDVTIRFTDGTTRNEELDCEFSELMQELLSVEDSSAGDFDD